MIKKMLLFFFLNTFLKVLLKKKGNNHHTDFQVGQKKDLENYRPVTQTYLSF